MVIVRSISAKVGLAVARCGARIYRAWFEYCDRTGTLRKSGCSEALATTRFQADLLYLRTILQEFCNVPRRIAFLHRYRLHRCGIPLLTVSERLCSARPQRYIYRQDRIRNIRALLSIHPGATLVDLFLVSHLGDHPRQSAGAFQREEVSRPSTPDAENTDSCRS